MVKLDPATGHRFDIDCAADLINVVADNVHADATAGHVGDLGGRRKARGEYELVDLRFGQFLDIGFGNEALRYRLGLNALGIKSAPVIGDPDDDVPALMKGAKAGSVPVRVCRRRAFARAFQDRDPLSCAPCA